MSILKQKLDSAAQQFQMHNFQQALDLYENCLSFCYKTDEAHSIIFNIMTTKASLHTILGEYEQALTALNEVLRNDCNHYLALIRRSQVYKKKGKFNKALNDIQTAVSYYPDNLQLSAMRIEIQNLKNKTKQTNSSDESDSSDEENEQYKLNFSNLKVIDRKSCSIMVPQHARKSRVTISGDTAFIYDAIDESEKNPVPSLKEAKQLFSKSFREIENDQGSLEQQAPKVIVKNNGRSKSILKNRMNVSLLKKEEVPQPAEERYGGRQSKFIQKIRDIDGKMISSTHNIEQGSAKEVQFRKSIFKTQPQVVYVPQNSSDNKKGPRKSCLKRSSFQSIENQLNQKPIRSKFDMLTRQSIDGVILKHGKEIDCKQNMAEEDSESSNEDSSHNIFGSKEQVVISQQLSQQLGLESSENKGNAKGKQRSNGGKSILKTSSLLSHEPSQCNSEMSETQLGSSSAKKSKKSVMFNKSRFANN